jgi:hypothetical protein
MARAASTNLGNYQKQLREQERENEGFDEMHEHTVEMSLQAAGVAGSDNDATPAAPPAPRVLPLSGNTVAPLVGTGALDWTNGNKVVVEPLRNGLHAVYSDQGKIKYVRSTDGAGWSAPITISGVSLSACREPSIAAGRCGQLGVAFRCSSGLYYTFGSGTSWSAQYLVDSSGSQPSIVASGDTIHLAYVTGGYNIYYQTFPIKSSNPGPKEYVADPIVLSGTTVVRQFPSIAVHGTTHPRVFVAFMEQIDRSTDLTISCPLGNYCKCHPTDPCFSNKVFVRERTKLCPYGINWCESFISTDHTDAGGVLSKPAVLAPSSLSVSGSGHLYLVWSEVWKGVARTMLAHSGSGALGSWAISPLLPTPTLTTADILAGSGTSFVVSWSELTTLNGHGPTSYNTGAWPGGPAPTFQSSPTLVTAAGRSPQALQWSRSCKNGGGVCLIDSIFEEKVSSTFSLKQDSACAPATGGPTCFSLIQFLTCLLTSSSSAY